eukprot:jgi/Botrbrau1/14836/Bobra.0278s0006.1
MASFLPSLTSASLDPDRIGRVRIIVVGNSGCGKTSLAHFLASGETLPKSSPTVGCNIFVKPVDYPDKAAINGVTSGKPYFVELWDIGANERYRSVRSVFYSDVSGVIVVHDLSQRSGGTVYRWAKEVAQKGTFSAAYAAEEIAANLGGLPVPCLIVANKCDKVSGPRGVRGRGPFLLISLLDWLIQQWHRFKFRRKDTAMRKSSSSWPDLESAGLCNSITASATQGRIDLHAVEDFFLECIAHRYHTAHSQQANGHGLSSGPWAGPAFRVSASPSHAQRRPASTSVWAPPGNPVTGKSTSADLHPQSVQRGLMAFFQTPARPSRPAETQPGPAAVGGPGPLLGGLGSSAEGAESGPGSSGPESHPRRGLLSHAASHFSSASSLSDYGGSDGLTPGQFSLPMPSPPWQYQLDGRIDDDPV